MQSRLPISPYVYVEEHTTKKEAMQREMEIKKMKKERKKLLFLTAKFMGNDAKVSES